ncbi:MAG: spore germination protein [Christensenellaceae bacterium]|nr:spore germination protein [Christensenellaceae bacterium]
MNEGISASLKTSCGEMDRRLNRDVNPDTKIRRFRVYQRDAAFYYVDGTVSVDFLQHYLLEPLEDLRDQKPEAELATALQNVVRLTDVQTAKTYEDAVNHLMTGRAVLLVEGMACALGFDARAFVRRGIAPPQTESVVLGPHEGFNESIRDNITLLRRILPSPNFIGEMRSIGDQIPVSLCVLYLKDAVDEDMLRRVKARLDSIRTDHVLSIGALEQMLEDKPFSLLPQCCLTERPDRTASMLLEGQIALLLDGSPLALVMPASILHLLHTPDDTSLRWQYGTFLRLLRLFGLLCALLLPGLFVAFVTFHPEALPVTLLTAVLESQAEVPLSIPAETFLMLIMFNLINEAGTRVPGISGSTLGTVSGLILGQAAVEARLIHPLLVIVVAVSSLGSYAVPDYSLGLAIRIAQLLFLAAGCIFGIYGMVLFCAAGTIRLCGMTSLGSPFAAPMSPIRTRNPDGWTRMPIWMQRARIWVANPADVNRTDGRMRGWDRRGNANDR